MLERFEGEYKAIVHIGVQYFTLQSGTKKECEWFIKMFRIALKQHNKNLK